MATTEAACLDALREAAEKLGESPTKAQYEELGLRPASTTILRICGSWNEAKKQAGLNAYSRNENGGIDVQPKPTCVTIPDDEEWDNLTAQQRWYYKNRNHRIETKERRRKQLREWFSRLKREQFTCKRCDESRAPALDFHHPDAKDGGISQMVNHGYSKRRIREEMNKCTVICANCHRKEHSETPMRVALDKPESIEKSIQESSGGRLREKRRHWIIAYKQQSDGCVYCGVSNPVCLDFHHEGKKEKGIARMLSERYSLDEIHREIRNCVLLCANCHRVEHHTSRGKETDSV